MRKKTDIATLCVEAGCAMIGSMGTMAFAAFLSGSHVWEWNGVCTGVLFVALALGIWSLFHGRQIRRAVRRFL